jgi:hypothetical protein
MVEIPASLAVAAFDGLLRRGVIIHYRCRFVDGEGRVDVRDKFAVILNVTLPEDPILCALFTSQTGTYTGTTLYDRDIIRIAVGTYPFFTKDTVLSFRAVREEDLDGLRKQYANKQLKIVGDLLKVHLDETNAIIERSLLIEGWKVARCTPRKPPAPKPNQP